MADLRQILVKEGSAIVSIGGELGGHVIVVDEVSADFSQVRLREPYHGWKITVTKDAFFKRCGSSYCTIQVKKS